MWVRGSSSEKELGRLQVCQSRRRQKLHPPYPLSMAPSSSHCLRRLFKSLWKEAPLSSRRRDEEESRISPEGRSANSLRATERYFSVQYTWMGCEGNRLYVYYRTSDGGCWMDGCSVCITWPTVRNRFCIDPVNPLSLRD